MNKKILLISSVLLTLSLILVVTINNMDNKEKNIISNAEKDKQLINVNMITMMYETDAGTGEYVETKDNTWPESGYIFNDTLSGCENGGELEYNSENNTVNLFSNKSDKCYVYFDKYDGVWIDNVNITNVTGSSVTLSVSATSENGSITKYYYSLNDSEEYQEVTNNVITINDLNKLTEYKISIYAIDSTNAKSNIYEVSVSTTDESKPIINTVEVSNVTYKSFTLTVNATGNDNVSKYYYIIDSENLSGVSSNNSYTFNNLKNGTNYAIVILVRDTQGKLSDEYKFNVSTENLPLFANYIKEYVYESDGTNNLYYHDGSGSYTNANLEAGDNSYRYAGANPNNYVCFGSDEVTCPNDNLYRVIGVFDSEVKLIKGAIYGSYYWSGSNSNRSNVWSNSTFNTNTLNGTYLNGFSEYWKNMIAYHDWKVGGILESRLRNNVKTAFSYEVGNNSSNTIYNAKIGLIYITDYSYAVSPSWWSNQLYGFGNTFYGDENWLDYVGSNYGMTITRNADSYDGTTEFFGLSGNGSITRYASVYGLNYATPTFYLSSNVVYLSGSGTQSDPYHIGL